MAMAGGQGQRQRGQPGSCTSLWGQGIQPLFKTQVVPSRGGGVSVRTNVKAVWSVGK